LELAPPGVSFEDLDTLRAYLERTLGYAPSSLRHYYDKGSGGFFHKIDLSDPPSEGKYSKASTATCLTFLDATGQLSIGDNADEDLRSKYPWAAKRADLQRTIVTDDDWSSAGLDPDNPFTVSFLLEAVDALSGGRGGLDANQRKVVFAKLELLLREILDRSGDNVRGSVRIDDYPPTAFLTQAAVRVLLRWGKLTEKARKAVAAWTWSNLQAESVLIASGSADADVFELAYSVLTASAVVRFDRMTPQQRRILQYAIDQFFDQQEPDGTWPRSRPLFLYPKLGYAYCFDYELLVQLLSDQQLVPMIFNKLDKLSITAYGLDQKKYPLGKDAYGWSSEHHGQSRFAESWSTASALHFCFRLERYVAEAIRRVVFDYAGGTYSVPSPPKSPQARLPDSFLDSRVKPGTKSLKRIIRTTFLQPLLDARANVEQGRALPKNVPVSAILFGPPGTSKTELAKLIATALGWPFLGLDPSHLTRNGLDQVHAEAHRLFGMLQSCDQVVVLLDEFDELVREREKEGQIESRFLTTAMLPKLAALSERRRLVFILATNHLERFDIAIRRPGRFDMIIPVMPPTASAKLKEWPLLSERLAAIKVGDEAEAADLRKKLDDLTYLECKALVQRLKSNSDLRYFADAIRTEAAHATIMQPVVPRPTDSSTQTWRDRIASEIDRIRIPAS
jgi:hypothetical protein